MVKLKYFVFGSDTQDTGAVVDEISLQFQRKELLRNPYSRLTQFAANSQCIVHNKKFSCLRDSARRRPYIVKN